LVNLTELHSLVDDASLTTSLYEAKLEDPDAGVPGDLFSGHGSVLVEDDPYSVIEDSTITANHIATPTSDMTLSLTTQDTTTDVNIFQLRLSADIDPLPNEEMLEGGLTDGTICGAVDWSELVDWLALKLELEPAEQAALSVYLQANADLECEDTDCEQISFGIVFSAVSAIATQP
jgi:hypothetical protein